MYDKILTKTTIKSNFNSRFCNVSDFVMLLLGVGPLMNEHQWTDWNIATSWRACKTVCRRCKIVLKCNKCFLCVRNAKCYWLPSRMGWVVSSLNLTNVIFSATIFLSLK